MANKLVLAASLTALHQRSSVRCARQRRRNSEKEGLMTGGSDGRFRVWEAERGAELWSGMAATLRWDTNDQRAGSRRP
jgi:hypothetical protein